MSVLEGLCNHTLYAPLDTRVGDAYSWMALLISLQAVTGLVAAYPLYLYYRLERTSRASLWPRFVPFFSLLIIGAVAGIISWSSYMQQLVSIQITTSQGPPLESYHGQPMSYWYRTSFVHLVPFCIFLPIEFSCFVVAKMFVVERLLTFGTSSMGSAPTTRARLVFNTLFALLCFLFFLLVIAGCLCAAFAAPFARSGLGLNLYDKNDRNNDDIEAGLNKLFTATSFLFITMALILVVSAFGCLLFCFYCFRRIKAVSLALLSAHNMSSARAQAAEATLRKTRVLIMSTSAVVSVSLIMRATFQIVYGSTFTAKYNLGCSSQCNNSCQDDLFLLQVSCCHSFLPLRADTLCDSGDFKIQPRLCRRRYRHLPVPFLYIRILDHDLQSKKNASARQWFIRSCAQCANCSRAR